MFLRIKIVVLQNIYNNTLLFLFENSYQLKYRDSGL
mgnify:FL=1